MLCCLLSPLKESEQVKSQRCTSNLNCKKTKKPFYGNIFLKENSRNLRNVQIKVQTKSLKVFRLKATILGLQFVNLMMFNCSLLSKTCLNVYRPTSPILSLPGTSCKLLSNSAPAMHHQVLGHAGPSWAKLG